MHHPPVYQVDFYTLAIMPNGSAGNVRQAVHRIYSDRPLPEMEKAINAHLRDNGKEETCVITEVKALAGWLLKDSGPIQP